MSEILGGINLFDIYIGLLIVFVERRNLYVEYGIDIEVIIY